MLTIRTLALCALIASAIGAQTLNLSTPYNSNNGQAGNMFDITAANDVSIQGFDVNLDPGTFGLEVYTLPGASYSTDPNNTAMSWQLVGTYTGIVSAGNDVPTRLGPLATCVDIPAGQTNGFYITVTTTTGMNYTTAPAGTLVGSPLQADSNLTVTVGAGLSYPFAGGGTLFEPRQWNGTVYYFPAVLSGVCLPLPPILPPLTPYQTNPSPYTLDVNGVFSTGQAPAVSEVGTRTAANVNFGGAVGIPFDTAIAPGASLVPGYFNTPNNQTVNIDLLQPGLFWLSGPTFSPLPFAGNFTVPVAGPSPFTLAAQAVHLDPAFPDGFALTQAVDHRVTVCSGSSDFESLTSGQQVLPAGWANGVNGSMNWRAQTGGTGSLNTGPTAASGGGIYIYAETSTTAGSVFTFDTCGESIGNLSTFTLEFALSRIGAAIGTLEVFMDDGSGTYATLLATYTGPDATQAQGATEWSLEQISFAPFITSATVSFRFQYTLPATPPAGASTFQGDLAIDEMRVL